MPRPSRLLVEYPANRVPHVRAYERRGGTGGRGELPVMPTSQQRAVFSATGWVLQAARTLVENIDESRLSETERYMVVVLRDRLDVLSALEGTTE